MCTRWAQKLTADCKFPCIMLHMHCPKSLCQLSGSILRCKKNVQELLHLAPVTVPYMHCGCCIQALTAAAVSGSPATPSADSLEGSGPDVAKSLRRPWRCSPAPGCQAGRRVCTCLEMSLYLQVTIIMVPGCMNVQDNSAWSHH